MQCAQHPSDAPSGICASCLRDRLTDLLQLQQNRFRVPFSAPLPAPSPPSQNTEADRIRRSQSVVAQEKENSGSTRTVHQFTDEKPVRGKFPFSSRFKQGQGHGHSKMHVCGEVEGSPPSHHEKKENGQDQNTRKPRSTSAWISALLPRRHRKKSGMPAPAPAAAPLETKNLEFLSERSSLDKRTASGSDFVGRDEAFHEQLANSRPAAFVLEDYYSDSDLTKRSGGGGGGGEANPRLLSRLNKRVNGTDTDSRAASCSTTARVNIFSESEDNESGKSSPDVNRRRQGNCDTYFSGGFASPTPKAKGWVGAGLSKYTHPDCAGSFSPYTDRKLQSSKPFSMARREDSGSAFCPSPRKLFNHRTSRSPRHGGKLSTFFFSPLRRTT